MKKNENKMEPINGEGFIDPIMLCEGVTYLMKTPFSMFYDRINNHNYENSAEKDAAVTGEHLIGKQADQIYYHRMSLNEAWRSRCDFVLGTVISNLNVSIYNIMLKHLMNEQGIEGAEAIQFIWDNFPDAEYTIRKHSFSDYGSQVYIYSDLFNDLRRLYHHFGHRIVSERDLCDACAESTLRVYTQFYNTTFHFMRSMNLFSIDDLVYFNDVFAIFRDSLYASFAQLEVEREMYFAGASMNDIKLMPTKEFRNYQADALVWDADSNRRNYSDSDNCDY